jgi:hypothetical protein
MWSLLADRCWSDTLAPILAESASASFIALSVTMGVMSNQNLEEVEGQGAQIVTTTFFRTQPWFSH